jgi:hypothetical protein
LLGIVNAVAVNVAEVEPAGTVTEPGTVRRVPVFDNVTDAPPAGAGPLNVAVHVEIARLINVEGAHDRAETVGRAVTMPAVPETPEP